MNGSREPDSQLKHREKEGADSQNTAPEDRIISWCNSIPACQCGGSEMRDKLFCFVDVIVPPLPLFIYNNVNC